MPEENATQLSTGRSDFLAKMLGMTSIPAMLFYPLGAAIAILFGLVEIRRIRRAPELSNQRSTVINCITLNAIGLFIFGLMFSFTYPKYRDGQRLGRETLARSAVYTVHEQEQQYRKTKPQFGTFAELWQSGSLDQDYNKGMPVDGYVYSVSDLSENTYCIHADRADDSAGYNDYVMCEDGILRFSNSENNGTVSRGGGELWPYPSLAHERARFDPCR